MTCSLTLLLVLLLPGCSLFEIPPKDDGGGGWDTGSTSGDGTGGDGDDGTATNDADGDGYPADQDCDDTNPDIFPGADEVCNGEDDNCDGVPDENNGVIDGTGYYYDADGDGYGDPEVVTIACELPPAHSTDPTDCDDSRSAINPGAQEACDGVDNDCDDLIDDADDSLGGATADWYVDADGDGYGNDASVQIACSQPSGTVAEGGDCNDDNAAVRPFANETCNGVDDDCDGSVDEDPVGSGTTYYDDDDNDGYGDDTTAVESCSPLTGQVTTGGDCDDAAADVNPGEVEVCDDGIDNDCDGGASGCSLEGDVNLSGGYDLRLVGEDAFDYAARSVALMPDVSGDGVPDIAVGAVGDDYNATNGGSVYLMRGSRLGSWDLSAADGRLAGESSGDEAGAAVAGLGDVNGDGVGDLLVGAPGKDRTDSDVGGAWLVLGPVTSARNLFSADYVGFGESDRGYAGFAVSAAGDVSGDGVADLLVGAPGEDNTGAVYVPSSSNTGRASMASAPTLYGEASGDLAGDAVSGGNDLDGDGVNDVVVGARQNDGAATASGSAYVVYGPVTADLDLSSADLILRGEAANDAAGSSVLLADDLTGDGLPDAVVGATGQDGGGTGAGAAYVVAGGTTGTISLANADAVLYGRTSGDAMGGAMCLGGDVDGDGNADLLVGAQSYGGTRGAVFLFTGPLTGTIGGPGATARIRGASSGDRLTVCGGGQDVDGDGNDDVLVGGEGATLGGNYAGAAWLLRPQGL